MSDDPAGDMVDVSERIKSFLATCAIGAEEAVAVQITDEQSVTRDALCFAVGVPRDMSFRSREHLDEVQWWVERIYTWALGRPSKLNERSVEEWVAYCASREGRDA